jgi:Zn-dependent peptidase ImmA (M78 family)/DNA-binding XRE family transcriptional regulator
VDRRRKMALTKGTLGRRLREARMGCGLTQEEAAASIDIPRTSLLQIEAGKRVVSSLEVVKLARLYGCDVASLLAEEEPEVEHPLVALYRIAPTLADRPETRRGIQHYLNLFQEGIRLEGLLGTRMRTAPPAYDLPDPASYPEAVEQGEWLAAEERKRLNLGARPIPDVAEVIAQEGIWASAAPLPEDFSGVFLHQPAIGLAILVNQGHARGRRRFSYSHEYAHALLDRRRGPAAVTRRANASELVERRANAFAGEFLVPRAGVEEVLEHLDRGAGSREYFWLWDVATESGEQFERRNAPGSQALGCQDAAYLAHRFMVSYDAAVYRLSDMRCISRAQVEEFLALRSEGHQYIQLLRMADPHAPAKEDQPRLISQLGWLAVEAFRREAISSRELVHLCGKLGIDEGEKLVSLARACRVQ